MGTSILVAVAAVALMLLLAVETVRLQTRRDGVLSLLCCAVIARSALRLGHRSLLLHLTTMTGIATPQPTLHNHALPLLPLPAPRRTKDSREANDMTRARAAQLGNLPPPLADNSVPFVHPTAARKYESKFRSTGKVPGAKTGQEAQRRSKRRVRGRTVAHRAAAG
jgi:hypothetical protein